MSERIFAASVLVVFMLTTMTPDTSRSSLTTEKSRKFGLSRIWDSHWSPISRPTTVTSALSGSSANLPPRNTSRTFPATGPSTFVMQWSTPPVPGVSIPTLSSLALTLLFIFIKAFDLIWGHVCKQGVQARAENYHLSPDVV